MLALLLVQEGEFTPFSINTGLIFWTIVVFAILLALLWRFGWPALLKTVEERERRIQQQLEEAERARAEAARLLEEHTRTIATAKAEAQEIVARAKAVADKERETLLARARQEYEQLLERARHEIDAEKEKAIVELRREAVDLSIAAASKLLQAQLDSETNRNLVMGYLAQLEAEQADERIAVALDSPRVTKATKAALFERALGDVAPLEFVRFLQAVVRRGRQGLLREIAQQYQALVDLKLDRVHAGVVLVEEPDARLEKQIVERLTAALGKDVRAHFRAERGIIGGVVVRVGDRVYDGSLKRKLTVLRRKMLTGD